MSWIIRWKYKVARVYNISGILLLLSIDFGIDPMNIDIISELETFKQASDLKKEFRPKTMSQKNHK